MSFSWLHQKISLRASIAAIGVAVAITIVCLQVCAHKGFSGLPCGPMAIAF
jgi:hypothetical protein